MTNQDYTIFNDGVSFIEEPSAEFFNIFSVPKMFEDNIVFKELKKVEMIARVCYKSERVAENLSDTDSFITTAKFISMLLKRKHYAMFEHAIFHFKARIKYVNNYYQTKEYLGNSPYCYINSVYEKDLPFLYVTTNLRFLLEGKNSITYSLKKALWSTLIHNCPVSMKHYWNALFQAFFGEDTFSNEEPVSYSAEVYSPIELDYKDGYFKKYYTFKLLTDRGVTHELVRHRIASYAQESTRYCNYNKQGISFMFPANYSKFTTTAKNIWVSQMYNSASAYNSLIKQGVTPQDARSVLPNALVTTIVVTVDIEELKHILDLRFYGVTGSPHPDMKYLMTKVFSLVSNDLKD